MSRGQCLLSPRSVVEPRAHPAVPLSRLARRIPAATPPGVLRAPAAALQIPASTATTCTGSRARSRSPDVQKATSARNPRIPAPLQSQAPSSASSLTALDSMAAHPARGPAHCLPRPGTSESDAESGMPSPRYVSPPPTVRAHPSEHLTTILLPQVRVHVACHHPGFRRLLNLDRKRTSRLDDDTRGPARSCARLAAAPKSGSRLRLVPCGPDATDRARAAGLFAERPRREQHYRRNR